MVGRSNICISFCIILQGLLVASLMIVLPLAGVYLRDEALQTYLEFPPLTRYVDHAPFSWPAFFLFASIELSAVVLIVASIQRVRRRTYDVTSVKRDFPTWGWLGLVVMLGGWGLAWSRVEWFAPFQAHTFCLPWIGYIVFVNALCQRRTGRCLIGDAPRRFGLLILASALFWWFFEYLNRFVQNWYYTGIEEFGAPAYALFASLAFATVLPAVLSTYRWLLTFPLFATALADGFSVPAPRRPCILAVAILATAAAGLALLGVYPDALFALLWISPLLILTALQSLAGRQTIFSPLARGDWRALIAAALAALICGFFWEMWNIGSLARWHYAIPYVDRFHLFAMPVLGYGGYLPFGLECLAVGEMVVGRQHLLAECHLQLR